VKALWQDVLEEAAHELAAGAAAVAPAGRLAVPVSQGDGGVVEGDKAGIGDGDAEDVAGEIVDHSLLALAPQGAMDDPRLAPGDGGDDEAGTLAGERRLELAAHQLGEGFDREEERLARREPIAAIGGDAAAGIGNSREIGVEISAKGKLIDRWSWSVGYAPRIVMDRLTSQSAVTGIDFKHTTPIHVINASLGWSSGPWKIDGFARWESSSTGFANDGTGTFIPVRIGSHLALDARIGYDVTDNLTLAVSGQQLTMNGQRQTALGDVDRRVLGTVSVRY
jgi:hypothetical protein